MNVTKHVALGIYPNRSALELGVNNLKAAGISPKDISVVVPESTGTLEERNAIGHNAADAAKVGAGTGAVVGGTLGLLAGAGLLAIPGIGAFLVLGALGPALLGTVAGGGLGTLIGSFIGLNSSADEIKVYEERLKKGAALASIECADTECLEKAEKILAETGAEKIYHKP